MSYPERVVTKQQQYKQIKAGVKDVESWLTSDGVYHDTEAKALKRQAELDKVQAEIELWKTIKTKKFNDEHGLFNIPDTFYFAGNQEQFNLITRQLMLDRNSHHFVNGYSKNSLKVGDWIGHTYEDEGL